jgi:hypothetical protein
MESFRLLVIEVQPQPPNVECVVKCLEGSVRVGDTVRADGEPVGHGLEGFVVQEILYFGQMLAELESNFGGKLLMSTLGSPPPLLPGVYLVGTSASRSD